MAKRLAIKKQKQTRAGVEIEDFQSTDTINCSRCGKIVSSPVPDGTIVRAFVECPECVEKSVDPLKPSLALLVKIGSTLVHADEFMSPKGHELDKTAYDDLMRDAEVKTWLSDLTAKGYLPVKR